MARIAGVDLEKGKRIDIALTRIYGIGRMLSSRILTSAEVAP
ncbi:MAG: 30S ribosomal protein S13, partial [Thermodesulfobacteriota bacterium]